MFFALAKIGFFFLAPSNLFTAITGLGILAAFFASTRRIGLGMAAAGVVATFAFGLSPLPSLALHVLESRYPPLTVDELPRVDGIVVLGGSIQQDATMELGQPVLNEAGERITTAAILARLHPQARLLLSGGSGALLQDDRYSEADATARVLADLGVDPARFLIEDRSRDTFENARFSRAIADPQPGEVWLLVTSAWHMPRSMAVFRAEGFEVVPFPVDFRTIGGQELTRGFRSVSAGLMRLDIAAREYLGLLAYRLTGRTGELVPGPSPAPPSPGIGSASR